MYKCQFKWYILYILIIEQIV